MYSNFKQNAKKMAQKDKKNMNKVYPIGAALYKYYSPLSLSSLSLTLSQNSNDSSQTDQTTDDDSSSMMPLGEKIALAFRLMEPSKRGMLDRYSFVTKSVPIIPCRILSNVNEESGECLIRRCNWITQSSDKLYVRFHDECWGVPVYDNCQLFELLALAGMLMDFNWTEILRRKQLLREAFGGFDANNISKMGEKEMNEIASSKDLMISECRVRSIVDNSQCILKITREYGSFRRFIWKYVSYKPIINQYKNPGKVPLRTPKAEAISKDLQKRGFRFVGPVIVYSFMQAAGLTIDHLVHCFRYHHCVNFADQSP